LIIANCLGIFLIYYLTKELFDQKIGLLATFLYAISFAQTQYAIYFGNPSLAILTIMCFYLGWVWLIFGKNNWGWLLIGLGFGLSIQFENTFSKFNRSEHLILIFLS
jgi:4-amino-4-deoxy-L-arabinose transferase-like glycosyltransferase